MLSRLATIVSIRGVLRLPAIGSGGAARLSAFECLLFVSTAHLSAFTDAKVFH